MNGSALAEGADAADSGDDCVVRFGPGKGPELESKLGAATVRLLSSLSFCNIALILSCALLSPVELTHPLVFSPIPIPICSHSHSRLICSMARRPRCAAAGARERARRRARAETPLVRGALSRARRVRRRRRLRPLSQQQQQQQQQQQHGPQPRWLRLWLELDL